MIKFMYFLNLEIQISIVNKVVICVFNILNHSSQLFLKKKEIMFGNMYIEHK